jgi:hypothetical protein
MSDIREIEITVTHRGKVDCDRFFEEFAEEWRDFLAGAPEEPGDRDDFIADTVAAIGLEALDHFAAQYDTDWKTDIRPRRKS